MTDIGSRGQPLKPRRVPVAVIRPYVEAHIEEMYALEMGEIRRENEGVIMTVSYDKTVGTHPKQYSAIAALAFRAGLDESIVRRIWEGTREWISYDTADKLIAKGMHNFLLWYEEDLKPYYLEQIDTAYKYKGKQKVAA